MRYFLMALFVLLAGCNAQQKTYDWSQYQPPDWKKYRAKNASILGTGIHAPGKLQAKVSSVQSGRFTFADLKTESDASLAFRLLGENGKRIAYINRHPDRWEYYESDGAPVESIDLYTHPKALGSQFGLCGVEKYTVEFDDNGAISSVEMGHRYGVEGPLYQKSNFDWDFYYERMCTEVPASHAPSYFPAPSVFLADDAAELLLILFDQASSGDPKFSISCRSWDGHPCEGDIKSYIGRLRLSNIDELSEANCTYQIGSSYDVCFTVTTGTYQLGPFPKQITVKGSTHMNQYRINAIEVIERFTVS